LAANTDISLFYPQKHVGQYCKQASMQRNMRAAFHCHTVPWCQSSDHSTPHGHSPIGSQLEMKWPATIFLCLRDF